MEDFKLYKLAEVAELMKVTERTIYNYIKANQIKAYKVGGVWYFKKEDIVDFIENGTSENYTSLL